MINIGVIGIGAMGKKYALMLYNNEIEGFKLTAVVCRSEENRLWAKNNLKSVKVFATGEELYNSGLCQAVIIATPHKSHPQLTIDALKHNIFVMCDKPSSIKVSEALEMTNYGEFGLMFHNRTYPAIIKLKELISNNTIGKINRVSLENTISYRTSHYHNSSDWRSSWKGEGGGMLINQGQHIIDYFIWLFGMPKNIYANISYGKYNDFNVDDEAIITLDYGDCSGTFIMSTGEAQPRNYISVIGDMGKIELEDNIITIYKNEFSSKEYIKSSNINTRDNLKYTKEVIKAENFNKPYHIMLNNFRNYILGREKLIANGIDGKNAIEFTNAAYMSSWLKLPVNIPIDYNKYDLMLSKVIDNESV